MVAEYRRISGCQAALEAKIQDRKEADRQGASEAATITNSGGLMDSVRTKGELGSAHWSANARYYRGKYYTPAEWEELNRRRTEREEKIAQRQTQMAEKTPEAEAVESWFEAMVHADNLNDQFKRQGLAISQRMIQEGQEVKDVIDREKQRWYGQDETPGEKAADILHRVESLLYNLHLGNLIKTATDLEQAKVVLANAAFKLQMFEPYVKAQAQQRYIEHDKQRHPERYKEPEESQDSEQEVVRSEAKTM